MTSRPRNGTLPSRPPTGISEYGSERAAPFGTAGRAAGQNDDLGPATGVGRRGGIAMLDQRIERVRAGRFTSMPASGPASGGCRRRRSRTPRRGRAGRSPSRATMSATCAAAEAGIEQHDPRTALGGAVHRFQEAPVVTGQDRHAGTRTKPAPAPLVGQRISPAVQIAETKRTTLIDQRHPVVIPGSGDHRRRPQDAVVVERAQHREDPTGRHRPQSPGPRKQQQRPAFQTEATEQSCDKRLHCAPHPGVESPLTPTHRCCVRSRPLIRALRHYRHGS